MNREDFSEDDPEMPPRWLRHITITRDEIWGVCRGQLDNFLSDEVGEEDSGAEIVLLGDSPEHNDWVQIIIDRVEPVTTPEGNVYRVFIKRIKRGDTWIDMGDVTDIW